MGPRWLSAAMLRAVHGEAQARHGGAAGVRDGAAFERALARPRALHDYGEPPSTHALAAAYCAGIARARPFEAGNARAGILAAAAFLGLNGYAFRPPEPEVVHVLAALGAGGLNEAALAAWIGDNARREPPAGLDT